MLQNLILDIGNVICDWDPDRLMSLVLDNPKDKAQALAATIHNEDWLDLDRGTLDLDEAITRAQSRTDLPPEAIADIYTNLGPSLTELTTTTDAMRRAHEAGVPIYILSNMHAHAWAYLETSLDCWQYCRGLVISCKTGLIKPDVAIYQYLCDQFSVAPQSCVFVDDMKVNIEAAVNFGIQGEQLTNKHQGGQLIDKLVEKITSAR